MLDLILLVVLGVITWCVAGEGAVGAGMVLLSVVFAGLLAMNFFEPAAAFLDQSLSLSPAWSFRWDFVALVGLFTLFVFLLRMMTERFSPSFVNIHPMVFNIGRWGCGFLTGYVTVAFLLTAMHTAPIPRVVSGSSINEFLGFRAEGPNFFGMNPDRQWLGFTQWVSRTSLSRGRVFDGPRYVRGDFKGADGNGEIWPSFPIRYATRRELLAAGRGAGSQIGRAHV